MITLCVSLSIVTISFVSPSWSFRRFFVQIDLFSTGALSIAVSGACDIRIFGNVQ